MLREEGKWIWGHWSGSASVVKSNKSRTVLFPERETEGGYDLLWSQGLEESKALLVTLESVYLNTQYILVFSG